MEGRENSAAAPANPASTTGFVLGQRVQVASSVEKNMQVGTVKYIGPVAGYQGVWVGVDWDSGKGRHNGTVNGVHYFDTTWEQSGTFVRPYVINGGVSMLGALTARYKSSSAELDNGEVWIDGKGVGGATFSLILAAQPVLWDVEEMYVVSVRQRRVAVQFVGLEKIEERQKQLEVLVSAMLMYSGVRSAGPPGELRASAPNIRELDLSGNLLPDWNEVGRICDELPCLSVLDLSNSRIHMGPPPLPVLANLKTLVLNSCRLNWKHVEMIKVSVPQIEDLHLAGNLIRLIEPVEKDEGAGSGSFSEHLVQGFESLLLLNLEDNIIDSWEEIMKLSGLKSLKQLHLSGNRIQNIRFPVAPGANAGQCLDQERISSAPHFANLEALLLAKNNLTDWSSIDALDCLPQLKDVRFTGNPVVDAAGDYARFMIIARLSKITCLNGSEVKPRERKDSEIRYVRHVVSTSPPFNEAAICESHPRFTFLRVFHDIPVETVHVGGSTASKKLGASLLPVSIHCVAPSVGEKAPVSKKLPASTTVGKLKLLCEGIFKIKVQEQCLFLADEDTPFPFPLNDDMETLGDLGLSRASTILINDRATVH